MPSELWNSILIAKKLYGRMLEPVCRLYVLTRMELDILLFLANNPGYDTAADMVERRQLAKSQVSSSVAQLEAVSYTHLDVYKRQILYHIRALSKIHEMENIMLIYW